MTKFLNMFRDSDFATGLLLFAIATLSYSGTGDNMKDWVFPLMAAYTLFFISIVFLVKFALNVMNGKLVIDLTLTREQVPSVINVGFFCFFVVCAILASAARWVARIALVHTTLMKWINLHTPETWRILQIQVFCLL